MIECKFLQVTQGAFELGPVDFTLPTGSYGVIMGPTGCGKTTIIEMIAGLRQPDYGHIYLDREDITDLDPASRGIGYVPQDGAMFPTMTVADQLSFGLNIRRFNIQRWIERLEHRGRLNNSLNDKMLRGRFFLKNRFIRSRILSLARLLSINHLLDRYPQGLSGGERQRVALGRALAIEPRLLLLDEPLAALDEDQRGNMCDLLRRIHRELAPTVIHITHSSAEADLLATHRIRMVGGQIVETGEGQHSIPEETAK